MKVFIDENLSPQLVTIGHKHEYDTTCARDRGLLGASDSDILNFCVDDDRVCVTNDAGLIVLPMVDLRRQRQLFEAALQFIDEKAVAAEQAPSDYMVNRAIEIDLEGACKAFELPRPEA